MKDVGLFRQLTNFFKSARHLWGRCPRCGELFRLSDAAVSYGSEAPRDWLRKFQRKQEALGEREQELENWQGEVDGQEADVADRERELATREKFLDREAKARAKEYLKDDKRVRELMRKAQQEAVLRSRSTLLGKLFERLSPFLQRFNHDPRDIRALMDPIDYVCFDGLTTTRRVERIVFVEVKSGTSVVSPTQRSIMDAVRGGRIGTEVWQFGRRGVPIHQQLLSSVGRRRQLTAGDGS